MQAESASPGGGKIKFTKLLAACGLLLFLGSAGLGVYLLIGSLIAASLTDALHRGRGSLCPPKVECLIDYPFTYTSKLTVSTPTLSEDQTVALTLNYSYTTEGGPQKASLKVTLLAPEFHFEPSTPIMFTSSGHTTLEWILSPTKPGTFQVGVQIESPSGNYVDTTNIGINVTNVFGLSPWQIQLFSSIGVFLGPVLTFGWWYNKWRKRKRRKYKKAQAATQDTIVVQSLAKGTPQRGRKAKRRH